MKYMTADLLAHLQSRDESVLDAAEAQWDRQSEAYREYIQGIRSRLPHAVQSLLRRCLHDAGVLTIATDEQGFLSIFLDLGDIEKSQERFVELRYQLAPKDDGPGYDIRQHSDLADHGRPYKRWLYDEIELDTEKVYAHSILLTGGVELHLTFTNLMCNRLNYLIPPINMEKDSRAHALKQA